MQFSEKELEDYLFDYLSNGLEYEAVQRGLKLDCLFKNVLWFRQLNLEPYGIADLVGFYRDKGTIKVELIELKVVDLTVNDFEQISRYRTAIERYLRNTFKNPRIDIKCTLVGKSYDGFYCQNFMDLNVATFKYSLDGITFRYHEAFCNWHIPSDKDKTARLWKKSMEPF